MGTVIVLLLLAGVIGLIIRSMIRIKRRGNLYTAAAIVSTAAVIAMTRERENSVCQRK